MMKFDELFTKEVVSTLAEHNIHEPTLVQKESMTTILSGADVILCSNTGTGKTLAYLLPVLKNINKESKNIQAIVISPTRELSSQIYRQVQVLTEAFNLRAAMIIGGSDRLLIGLKKKPHIIVGCTDTIYKLNQIKKLSMHYVKTIVLDEADVLLNKVNIESTRKLIKITLKDRQLVAVAAALRPNIRDKCLSIMKNPIEINTLNNNFNTEHTYFLCESKKKFETLRKVLAFYKFEKILIFVNNKINIQEYVMKLNYHNIKARGISRETSNVLRRNAIKALSDNEANAVVTSDILSRGMDIKDLDAVINMQAPQDAYIYMHRSGRCGRHGKKGMIINLINNFELKHIKQCEKQLNIEILPGLVHKTPKT
jgi:superfamily II DNA/RNA helicase